MGWGVGAAPGGTRAGLNGAAPTWEHGGRLSWKMLKNWTGGRKEPQK